MFGFVIKSLSWVRSVGLVALQCDPFALKTRGWVMSTSPRCFWNRAFSLNPLVFLSFGPCFRPETAKIIAFGSCRVCDCSLSNAVSDKQLNLVQVFQVGHGNICVNRAEKLNWVMSTSACFA